MYASNRISQQQRIFISYRRDDSQWATARLADSLARHFGDNRIFRDIEGIAAGARFDDVIADTLSTADALIVVIGSGWLGAVDSNGQRRLDDPDDWVVREIAMALEKDLPVYPVLIGDIAMPRADELPESLRGLTRHNAVSLRDAGWHDDIERLGRIIALDIPSASERELDIANRTISLALFVGILLTLSIVVGNLLISNADPATDGWSPSHLFTPADDEQIDWVRRFFASADDAATDQGRCANPPKAGYFPLGFVQSGIIFLIIAPVSAWLFVAAPKVVRERRRWLQAAAWTGAVGATGAFVLLYPVCTEYEAIVTFYLGMVIAPMMLVFMSLSGFRPK